MPTFTTIDGVSRELTGWSVMIGGVSRELDSMTACVDGVQREIFRAKTRWERYSVRSFFVTGDTSSRIFLSKRPNTDTVDRYAADYLESGTAPVTVYDLVSGDYFLYNEAQYQFDRIHNQYVYGYTVESFDAQRDTLLDTVESSDPSAYPENGKHTDGYWYVKIS